MMFHWFKPFFLSFNLYNSNSNLNFIFKLFLTPLTQSLLFSFDYRLSLLLTMPIGCVFCQGVFSIIANLTNCADVWVWWAMHSHMSSQFVWSLKGFLALLTCIDQFTWLVYKQMSFKFISSSKHFFHR